MIFFFGDFPTIDFKIQHNSYIASGSASLPEEKFWLHLRRPLISTKNRYTRVQSVIFQKKVTVTLRFQNTHWS